jgi:ligand-binding sensor domain-containing protein
MRKPALSLIPLLAACAILPACESVTPEATATPALLPRPTAEAAYTTGPPSRAITNLAVAGNGDVWYSYGDNGFHPAGGGLDRLSEGQVAHYGSVFSSTPTSDANVQMLALDSRGGVWASAGCGLARFDGQTWQTLIANCDHFNGPVFDIAFAAGGAVWVATPFKLGRFDGKTWTTIDRMPASIALAPDGTLWVSGWEGLQTSWYVARYDGHTWTSTNTVDQFGGMMTQLVFAPDGILWGATNRIGEMAQSCDGVASYDGRTWMHHLRSIDGQPQCIHSLRLAPGGALWALTDRGLFQHTASGWSFDRDSSAEITAFDFAPDGTLWIGTARGDVRPHHPRIAVCGISQC